LPEYHNPQQEPGGGGGQSRMTLVLVVTFALILIGQFVLVKNKAKNPPPNPSSPAATEQSSAPAAAAAAQPEPASPTEKTPDKAVVPAEHKAASGEVETVAENDFYRIVFTNKGAQAKSWVLKKFKDEKGQPLDLVNSASLEYGLPLGLYTYDEKLREQLNSGLYVSNGGPTITAPGELTYEYSDGGVTVRKAFRFDDTYVLHVEVEVTQNGKTIEALPTWPAAFGDQSTGPAYASSRVEYEAEGKVTRLEAKKVSGGNTVPGPLSWAGVQDQYFAAIFLPDQPRTAALVSLHHQITVPKDPDHPDPNKVDMYQVLGAAVGSTHGVTSERMFVGPKAVDVLESVQARLDDGKPGGPDLRHVVDFGYFSFFARPLFQWLKWTYHHMVHNWGWSIIILTVIINIALLPLRITSQKSALKMQKLQPQMKAIQAKYKNIPMRDPKRAEMNAEINDLYKKEGVNPAGGCLPLLIQLPFLWAFYSMLGNAIELRHAQFLWIHDLSSPDKLYILPVLIVVSTFWMQKLTPSAGMDPAQQKMMTLMMPAMLGFFSWSLPSGLSLYWTMGNAIAIIQQSVMNRTGLGQEMRAEMEKRARKSNK
jgi:YidC/Oxa1 family membrane protein insertase